MTRRSLTVTKMGDATVNLLHGAPVYGCNSPISSPCTLEACLETTFARTIPAIIVSGVFTKFVYREIDMPRRKDVRWKEEKMRIPLL